MAEIKPPNIQDRTLWYSQLAYMPSDYKESRLWMAQSLYYSRINYQLFQEPRKANLYRRADVLKLDGAKYKQLIDPPTAKANGGIDKGGLAEYFSADFDEAFPIDVHLDNILDADLRTIPLNLTCTLADPIAKLQEQKDKEKIIYQQMVRNIINEFAKELGLPKIGESEDPYKWIQNFTAEPGKDKIDTVGDAIDQIKTKIKDDTNLRLFQNYLYKNGLEVTFEIAIKYFLLDLNEWQIKFSHKFAADLKHFNKACGRWAIDETTGQGEVKYIDPTILYTSPFRDKNGDDIIYYFYEEDVTFAEFERLVGSEMTDEEKRKALTLQKQQGWITGGFDDYGNNIYGRNSFGRNNSHVRLGFFSILTQEANAFSEKYMNEADDVSVWDNKPLNWEPEANENRKAKVFNVWYSCYYMPITALGGGNGNGAPSPTDWNEQSKFIFKIQKDIDMQRYGTDRRYAKSSFVIWSNPWQASWTDIKEKFMPKIQVLWLKFQNCIVQDVQGLAMDEDLIGGMLNAVDEGNKDSPGGGKAIVDQWRMLRQAGMAWLKFRDKNGNFVDVDPSKLFVPIDSGHLAKGERYLLAAMNLYALMTQALAKGQAGEGVQPKARTPLGGIEIANEASSKATYFIEESYIDGVVVPFAMKAVHHTHNIFREKKDYNYDLRYKRLMDVIGAYNGAVIESIEKVKLENIGLTVANKDVSAKKEIIFRDIVTKFAQKQVSAAMLGLVMFTDNAKLQIVELSMEEQRAQEIAEQQAEAQHQREMEQIQMQLQVAQALAAAKGDAKDKNILMEGKVQGMLDAQLNQLKATTMAQQKEQLLQNKLTENQQKAELKKDDSTHDANLEQQKELIKESVV